MFRAGLCSISFRKFSPAQILRAAADAGLTAVEWGSDVHVPAGDTALAARIAADTAAAGLRCDSYGSYFKLGVSDPAQLAPLLETACVLGAPVMRVWCGNCGSAEADADTVKRLIEAGNSAVEAAKPYGITLCTECHPNTQTDDAAAARAFLDAVPGMRTYWQPNQWKTVDENRNAAAMLASKTVHLHVFHWEKKEKYPLADGTAVWRRYLGQFAAGEHNLYLEFMPDGRLETLAREAATLRQWITEEIA